MLRLLFIFIFIGNIIVLSPGCSFTGEVNSETNKIGQVNSNVLKRVDSIEKQPNNDIENDIKKEIKEFSLKQGLVPLPKTTQRNGFDLRLWINLGMPEDEKLLIVHTSESGNHTYFYHLRETADDPSRLHKEVIADPKNGWNTLQSEISNRLATPKRLVLDPQFHITRHEGVISLEVVEKGEYQFVFYGHHSSFDDAVRLINLCEYLSSEFGINIDCRGERTTLGPIR